MTKKLLSLLVAALMVLALVPMGSLAFGLSPDKGFTRVAGRDVVTVTLTAGDVWGDGSGYQMLLDADAAAYGSIIPETGGLTSSGDASADTYAEFEYKIPENADGSCSTTNIVLENSVTITIPAGTYDWCITNPTPGDRIWIASEKGTAGGGRVDDFVFEGGHTYEFVVSLGSDGHDRVDLVYDGEEIEEPHHPIPDGALDGYYFENDYEFDHIYVLDLDGDSYGWGTVATGDLSSLTPYEGDQCVYSASYYGGALTPDNWLIFDTPTVPSTGMTVTFWARGYGSNTWCKEHFAAYAITEADIMDENFPNNLTSLTPVLTEQEATLTWTEYTVNLSAYAGQDVMFAIRHFNCTDMYYLFVDQVEFWGVADDPGTETYEVTFVDGLTNEVIDTVEVNEGEDATPPEAPVHPGYTFDHWEGDYTNVTDDVTVTAVYTLNSYTLTIEYCNEDGEEIAPAYTAQIPYGTDYEVPSPEIDGYTTEMTVVSGTMPAENVEIKVTYTAVEVPPAGLPGDVNCDGKVNMADLSALSAYMLGKAELSAEGLANADVSGDGNVDARDLPLIYQLTLEN